MTRRWANALSLVIFGVLLLGGCGGDGGGNDPYVLCGNGHLDPGEQCDDGNTYDIYPAPSLNTDTCLSTCVPASCTDRFGSCTETDLNGQTCASFSRVDVTGLTCTSGCRFDLSGCGATFTPAPTMTPSPAPTPPHCNNNGLLGPGERCADCPSDAETIAGGEPCCPADGSLVSGTACAVCPEDCTIADCTAVTPGQTISVSFTAPESVQSVGSITVLIGYRSDTVSLPGTGNVASRVKKDPTIKNAFPFSNDLDYAVRVGLKASPFPPGPLFTIVFDACQGATVPTADDFSCTVEGCDDPSCTVDGCPAPSIAGCSCTVAIP